VLVAQIRKGYWAASYEAMNLSIKQKGRTNIGTKWMFREREENKKFNRTKGVSLDNWSYSTAIAAALFGTTMRIEGPFRTVDPVYYMEIRMLHLFMSGCSRSI
jgi:hypothetical protein